MDRIVEVRVNGSHVWKDSQSAGVQGEANATWLRIEFDDSWDGFTKTITWWDAKGENPTPRVLTAAELEDIKASTRIYLTPVPPEALAIWGKCMFAIDGYTNGRRQRSTYTSMVVKPKGNGEDVTIEDVTPSQAEQLQAQIEQLLEQIQALENGDADVHSVPGGGTTGQVLMKASDKDHDAMWATFNGTQVVVDLTNIEKTLKEQGEKLKALEGGAVRYDVDQKLPDSQKAAGRLNVAAASEAFVTAAINTALGNYSAALSGLDDVIGGGGV